MQKIRMSLLVLVLMILILPVLASSPAAPAGAIATSTNFASTSVPVAIPTGPAIVSDTLTVSGAGTYLFDVDMTTFITHTFGADLDITLTSPAGTVVTITTDNGAGNDDVFNGTVWDDDAATPVSDHIYANLILASPLTPEGAFGAFIGEDPNGVWTLTISDDLAGDGGSINNWSLDITTLNVTPATVATITSSITVPVAIPTGPAVVSDTITVSGAGTYLLDLDMTTFITHTFGADLDITLTSPAGTTVTITTDNGAGNDDIFNGTVWDDSAGTPASDYLYVNAALASPLTPEGAFGAFIGEDPNGVWTLTISDDLAGDGGSIDNWTLDIETAGIPVYASSPAIGAIALNTTAGTAVNQVIAVSEAGSADLTISSISLVGNAEISLLAVALPFTIVDGSGTSTNIPIRCSSAVAGTFTATLTVTNNSATSPEIYNITCVVKARSAGTGTVSNTTVPSTTVFDPAISKLGLLLPGQTGVTGERLEWIVTVSNTSAVVGQNVTITDTLIPALRVESVNAPNATVTINGQTVTVVYPQLNVGATVQFSILTTVLQGASVENTACVNASNQGAEECFTAIPVSQLPNTGETPLWRNALLLAIGLVFLSGLYFLRRQKA